MTTPIAQARIFTPATIRTASLYPLATLEERTTGTARVLVTRYWPRGLRHDRVDYWLRDLAPSRGLLKAYKQGGIPWDVFAASYDKEMVSDTHTLPAHLRNLEKLIVWHGAVTLLCVEHCPRDGHDESDIRCHRRLLRNLLLASETNGEEMPQP